MRIAGVVPWVVLPALFGSVEIMDAHASFSRIFDHVIEHRLRRGLLMFSGRDDSNGYVRGWTSITWPLDRRIQT